MSDFYETWNLSLLLSKEHIKMAKLNFAKFSSAKLNWAKLNSFILYFIGAINNIFKKIFSHELLVNPTF